jgi:hypothetical protein
MPPQRRAPAPLDRVLRGALEGRRLASVLVDATILERWADAVGPAVAARARPEGLRDGVLTVRVASSPWMAELAFLKPRLLDRINAALEAPATHDALAGAPAPKAPLVTDLRLVPGLPPAPPAAPPRPAHRPLTPDEGRLVESITGGVRDPLLRESIARALGRALARGPLSPAR